MIDGFKLYCLQSKLSAVKEIAGIDVGVGDAKFWKAIDDSFEIS